MDPWHFLPPNVKERKKLLRTSEASLSPFAIRVNSFTFFHSYKYINCNAEMIPKRVFLRFCSHYACSFVHKNSGGLIAVESVNKMSKLGILACIIFKRSFEKRRICGRENFYFSSVNILSGITPES